MTHLPDNIKNQSGATRSVREPEGPLLEIFWGKGDAAKAMYREAQEIIARKYPKPAKPARKPRQPSSDGLKTAAQAAAKLNCSIKTLNAHVAAGDLRYVSIGKGRKRPRRMFADADLNEFVANQTRKVMPCPSIAGHARRSGTSISGAEVIDFRLPRKQPTSGKQKK